MKKKKRFLRAISVWPCNSSENGKMNSVFVFDFRGPAVSICVPWWWLKIPEIIMMAEILEIIMLILNNPSVNMSSCLCVCSSVVTQDYQPHANVSTCMIQVCMLFLGSCHISISNVLYQFAFTWVVKSASISGVHIDYNIMMTAGCSLTRK